MPRVIAALLLVVGLIPATLHAAPALTYGAIDTRTELARSYFGGRYYASGNGRFTTVDPGHVNGDIYDPQSWNGYAYARNNPLKYTDPTGTTYEICAEGAPRCENVSDQYFAILQRNPGAGIRLSGGDILVGDRVVGSYSQISRDPTLGDFIRQTADLSAAGLKYGSIGMGVAAGAGAGALALGSSAIGVTSDVIFGGMGPSMAAAISQVGNPKLQRTLAALYQATDRLRGGTAAAVQFTRETGRLIGGSDHVSKASERVTRLQNILRQEPLSPSDRRLAEYALRQLQDR